MSVVEIEHANFFSSPNQLSENKISNGRAIRVLSKSLDLSFKQIGEHCFNKLESATYIIQQ